jgi:hypothetical protein
VGLKSAAVRQEVGGRWVGGGRRGAGGEQEVNRRWAGSGQEEGRR